MATPLATENPYGPGVRCPDCDHRLAAALNGTARFWCRRCKKRLTLTRTDLIPTSQQEAPDGRIRHQDPR